MGEPWKMPTKDQCRELLDNIDSGWTTINKVSGFKFANKIYSSKYIFIPPGGRWSNTEFNDSYLWGYYWSTTIYSSGSLAAYYMYFNQGGQSGLDYNWVYTKGRFWGHPIRAVRKRKW